MSRSGRSDRAGTGGSGRRKPSARRSARSAAASRGLAGVNLGAFVEPFMLRRAAAVGGWMLLIAVVAATWSFGVPRLATYAAPTEGASGAPQRAAIAGLLDSTPGVASMTGMTSMSSMPDGAGAPRTAPSLTASPVEIVFRELPPWMQGDELERLSCIVTESISDDPLDRAGLVHARERLLATGWFESIAQLRRREMDRIEVVGAFVTPAALVRRGERDHLIDADARLLPRSWPAGQGPALGVIVGASSDLPRHPGETWAGADLSAALAVLAVVDRQPWAAQIEAIDLFGFGADRSVRMLTNRGTAIRWGRAPGEERAAEVPAAMKLDYLMLHYRKYGHIDGGLSGEVDVSQDVAVVR